MTRICITRHDFIEHGKDCDGWYCISLFLRNYNEGWNGRSFLTYSLYRLALSSLKKLLKKFKSREDDLCLTKEECQEIWQLFNELRCE